MNESNENIQEREELKNSKDNQVNNQQTVIQKGIQKSKQVMNKGVEKSKGLISRGHKRIRRTSPQLVDNFEKKAEKTIADLFKDIEIRPKQMIVLYLIMISIGSIIAMNVRLGLTLILSVQLFGISFIMIGFLAGVIFAAITSDIFHHRYPPIIVTLFLSGVSTILELIIARNPQFDVLKTVIILINSGVIGAAMVFFLVLFIEYTNILERGRVFTFLLTLAGITCLPIIGLAYTDTLLILPGLIPLLGAIYLYKKRDTEKISIIKDASSIENSANSKEKTSVDLPEKSIKKHLDQLSDDSKSKKNIKSKIGAFHLFPLLFNGQYVRSMLFTFTFGIVSGLILPYGDFKQLLDTELFQSNFFLALLIIIIIIAALTVFLGVIFDFWGRKMVLSVFILLIGAITFLQELSLQIGLSQNHLNIALSFAVIVVLLVLIPLEVGELIEPKYYGRGSAFGLFFALAGVVCGSGFQMYIASTPTVLIATSLICVISLFFLANLKENISKLELGWSDSLYHLYVVHESGMLVYDHSFIEEDLATADLVSGGIIGLVTMLKEITRGKDDLRAIDHGDRKIMFLTRGNIIFVLMTKLELIVLRNKLQAFADDFEERFEENLKHIAGIIPSQWKDTKFLIQKHFSRKFIGEDLINQYKLITAESDSDELNENSLEKNE